MHIRHLIGSLDRGGAEHFLVRLVVGIAEREPTWHQSVWTLTNNVPLAPDLQRASVEVRIFEGGKSLDGIARLAALPRTMASEPCSLLQCWMYHAEIMGVLSRLRGARAPQVWTLRQSRLSSDANSRMTRLLMRVGAWGSRSRARRHRCRVGGRAGGTSRNRISRSADAHDPQRRRCHALRAQR